MAKSKVKKLYVPLEVDYYDNDKIVAAGERAEVLYVRGLSRAKVLLSDGILRDHHVQRLGLDNVKARADALVRVGLWERVEGGYRIVGYLERNLSAAEVEEVREVKRAAAILGNHKRHHEAKGVVDPKCPHCSDESRSSDHKSLAVANHDASQSASHNGSQKPRQVQSTEYIDPPNPHGLRALPPPEDRKPDESQPQDPLFERWMSLMPVRKRYLPREREFLANVLAYLRRYLDEHIIDERIGYCEAHAYERIGRTEFLFTACQNWARERLDPEHWIPDLPAHLNPTKPGFSRSAPNEPGVA